MVPLPRGAPFVPFAEAPQVVPHAGSRGPVRATAAPYVVIRSGGAARLQESDANVPMPTNRHGRTLHESTKCSVHPGGAAMNGRKYWEIGGFLAGGVLVLFGIVAIFMGVNGLNTTRDSIKAEGITFGTADDPAVAKYADQWAGEQVTTGDQARAFARIMRMHTLESTGGLTYASMGRFQSAAKPADPAGTNDETAAAKDATGQPAANGARNIWVTETALTTALNASYMAERLSVFGLVVGVALLLTGLGLVILAFAVFGRAPATATRKAPVTPQAVTG